jgi:hypothetical protein
MRLIRRGQSTAEYAVLFAIVIGAAIAMQQYVKQRLQGATKKFADEYVTAAQNPAKFEPTRETTSSSKSILTMTTAKAGTASIKSGSDTTVSTPTD